MANDELLVPATQQWGGLPGQQPLALINALVNGRDIGPISLRHVLIDIIFLIDHRGLKAS